MGFTLRVKSFQNGLTENVDSANGTKTSPKPKESDGCCTISWHAKNTWKKSQGHKKWNPKFSHKLNYTELSRDRLKYMQRHSKPHIKNSTQRIQCTQICWINCTKLKLYRPVLSVHDILHHCNIWLPWVIRNIYEVIFLGPVLLFVACLTPL